MNASIWQGPSGPLIGHIFLGVLVELKPRASSALVETVYGMDEGTIGPLWARNTPSANEIRTAHGRIRIFILLEADRTSIPSIVSHGRTMNVVVVDIRDYRKRPLVAWRRRLPKLHHDDWGSFRLQFSPLRRQLREGCRDRRVSEVAWPSPHRHVVRARGSNLRSAGQTTSRPPRH